MCRADSPSCSTSWMRPTVPTALAGGCAGLTPYWNLIKLKSHVGLIWSNNAFNCLQLSEGYLKGHPPPPPRPLTSVPAIVCNYLHKPNTKCTHACTNFGFCFRPCRSFNANCHAGGGEGAWRQFATDSARVLIDSRRHSLGLICQICLQSHFNCRLSLFPHSGKTTAISCKFSGLKLPLAALLYALCTPCEHPVNTLCGGSTLCTRFVHIMRTQYLKSFIA